MLFLELLFLFGGGEGLSGFLGFGFDVLWELHSDYFIGDVKGELYSLLVFLRLQVVCIQNQPQMACSVTEHLLI